MRWTLVVVLRLFYCVCKLKVLWYNKIMRRRFFVQFCTLLLILFFSPVFCFSQEIVESETENVEEETEPKKDNIFLRAITYVHSLPFGFDLGCEPTLNGSVVYFNLVYNLSKNGIFSSKFFFNYGTSLDDSTDVEWDLDEDFSINDKEKIKRNIKNIAIDFSIVPVAMKFTSKKNKKDFFSIEPGITYRLENETENDAVYYQNSTGSLLIELESEQTKHIVRPYFSGSLFSVVGSNLSASLDVIYAPVYFYWLNSTGELKIHYFNEETKNELLQTDLPVYKNFGLSENYVDATLMFGFFNMVAVSGRFIFERAHDNDIIPTIYNSQSMERVSSAEEENNVYNKLSFKIGGSFINMGKADIRIKTGLFYQWDWQYNQNLDEWTKSGKWVFGVGMRNLY